MDGTFFTERNDSCRQVMVSERVAEKLSKIGHWKDGAIGKHICSTGLFDFSGNLEDLTICGVFRDFRKGSLANNDDDTKNFPMICFYSAKTAKYMLVKIKNLTADDLSRLNEKVKAMYPNDDVMVNLSTAFGTGENMVGGGVSVRLGKSSNKLSREENNALKDQVNDLTARMDALLSVLNPNMSKDFPDVPENHWAYEAVSRLAGNDIVQGYPDGEFHGERTMTRYEMAEIIYNALSRGAEAEKELVEEFKPELQAMAASEKATAEKAEG